LSGAAEAETIALFLVSKTVDTAGRVFDAAQHDP
jgi:hypothetical protein